MSRWWRAYDDAINDPKLLRLSDEMHRAWFTLLCIASKHGGALPPADDIALSLRLKPAKVAEWITRLTNGGLLDKKDGVFVPHNWDGRQFKSDTSNDRVKRHRENKRNVTDTVTCNVTTDVTDTVTVTAPEQSIAESEQNRADARTLDERGVKQERALIDLFTALCTSLGHPKPDMKPIGVWLLDGIAFGTISEVCQPIIRRKSDMASLSYCDAAVREKHRGAQLAPSLSPVPMNDGDWHSVVKRWKSNQSLWPRGIGGEPGMFGCRCPANILADNLIDPATGRTMSEPLVFVHEQTVEMSAWCHHAQTKGRKPPVIFEVEIDGVVRRGSYLTSLVPDGYDSATGERIPPANSEVSAA